MATLTTVHDEALTLLKAAGLNADYGPRTTLTGQAVTLWPTAGTDRYTRAGGGRSGRNDVLTLTCSGPTIRDALAVAGKVRRALGGVRLPSGALLREDSFQAVEPLTEPAADPQRVSTQLTFVWTAKGLS